ncbi:hypothetical protein FB567DRAFT_453081 [Paraphoma chrysanthemicola]|uniref:Nonribosomal peptide synthetase 12 n=1 Tax=Paraphoma chrysanthemicola TaxID=798071 RepID=A0A8K0VUJ2_9PLEO|nr:hypothetical protein FB567DRAFT_453081 [Paraphoma chrysanthemicola]
MEGSELSPFDGAHVQAIAPTFSKKSEIELREDINKDITPNRHKSESLRPKSSWLSRFCLHWLTAYRILIAFAVLFNLTILVALIPLRLPLENVLVATAANLLASILTRQEDLINLSFGLVSRLPTGLPLGFRSIIADFHHYGGVHIGTAMSSLMWYVLFVGLNTATCVERAKAGTMTRWHWVDIITCYAFLTFLLLICLSAIPRFREKFHNHFERTHRFAGWASIIVLWINSGISTIVDPTHTPLYKSRSIWLLALTTLFIILPWLRIRRVSILAETISAREIKLAFPYANMPYTSTCRFSLSPLFEWHAFATIPSPDALSASIVISAAGDWTKTIVAHPPQRIWIRAPPTANFLSFTSVFNSVLLVATGAGIAPMLSLLASPAIKRMLAARKKVRFMWCVYDSGAPHWAFAQEAIRKVDPVPKILDSKAGRPDVAFEARYLAQTEGLEAVMVVSNKKVTNEVVREVKRCGGAAYGAVFDS